MVWAGILVVGNEILDGVVLDTNSNWLALRLKALGIRLKEVMVVRDDVDEIAKALRRMLEDDCKLVITSGGLGPTYDDKTLEGVAKALGLELRLNEEALRIVERQYRMFYERGVVSSPEITEPRRKMAVLPEGAEPLENRVGAAPGVLLRVGDTTIVSLPGVPGELKWIFDNVVSKLVKDMGEGFLEETIIELPSADESALASHLEEVMRRVPGVYVKTMPKLERGFRIWVSARAPSREEACRMVEKASKLLMEAVESS